MTAFAVVATRVTPTNTRLGPVLSGGSGRSTGSSGAASPSSTRARRSSPRTTSSPRRSRWRPDDEQALAAALDEVRDRHWFESTGAILQELVVPRGHDLRIVVAGGTVVGAVRRLAAPGEWRTNVAFGARREPVLPPADACELAVAAARADRGDLVGVDLLPAGDGWTALEVNGAVDFTGAYSVRDDVFAAARAALLTPRRARAGSDAAAAPAS